MNIINPHRVLNAAALALDEHRRGIKQDTYSELLENLIDELLDLAKVMPDQLNTYGPKLVQPAEDDGQLCG